MRPLADRNTADKILAIIDSSFKDTVSLAVLSQTLFNRVQQPTETIQSYSLALLKLNEKIKQKGGAVRGHKGGHKGGHIRSTHDHMLRTIFHLLCC